MEINSEEKKIIIPSIQALKRRGINLIGPLVSDTLFIEDYKKFDVIVGMYHDQVLTPFKTIFKFDAINVTLGLKYLRVSPDHGVAKKLIFKNKWVDFSFTLWHTHIQVCQIPLTKLQEPQALTIYEYFDALTNIGLNIGHSEEFEDAINDTLALIQESSLADIESGEEDD